MLLKDIKIFLTKKKTEIENMIMNDIKISQKMKNKSQLNIEKNNFKCTKIKTCYKHLKRDLCYQFFEESLKYSEPNYWFSQTDLLVVFSGKVQKSFERLKNIKNFGWVENIGSPCFVGLGFSIYNYYSYFATLKIVHSKYCFISYNAKFRFCLEITQ